MKKGIYKIGNKTYKTWEEYDTAIREYTEKNFDKFKEVKFEIVCYECSKVIKGKTKRRTTKNMTKMYCKKCFRKLFHPL